MLCAGPSLPFHNKNPFSFAHPLFKFLGPPNLLAAGREEGMCVLELSTPFHSWRNRLGEARSSRKSETKGY